MGALAVLLAVPSITTVFVNTENEAGGGSVIVTDNDVIDPTLRATPQYIYNKGKKIGYWISGKRDGKVVSEYKAYTGEGFASVTNGKGNYNDGGWQPAESWSRASLTWTREGTNRANYNYR
ncbi:hypothetical protein [Streptococcus orisratti]|uniref:hypothetical protein n=1 Tax=Streptococcus orisratti TaxID=114652 RepID=UPI003CFFC6AE